MVDTGGDRYVSTVQLRVLGPVEVVKDGSLLPLGGPKQRTVLALLVASAGRHISVDAVIAGLYGDDADPKARRTVHTYISSLRQSLGGVIAWSGDGYRLEVDRDDIDATRFEDMAAVGAAWVEDDPARAGTTLRDALALWRGHAYAGVETRGLLDGEIARLDELRLAAVDARVRADLAVGLHRTLVGELEALIAEHPYAESLRGHLMLALYRSGRQAEALRAFDRTRELLREELGIDPSPELRQLADRILAHDVTLDLTARPIITARAVVAAELDDALHLSSAEQRDALLARRDASLGGGGSQREERAIHVHGGAAIASFATVSEALDAVSELTDGSFRLAVDHGDVEVDGGVVAGPPVGRVLRVAAAGHPGQVLLSSDAHAMLLAEGGSGWVVRALGTCEIRGLDPAPSLFQLVGDGMGDVFPPLLLDRLPPPLPEGRLVGSVPGYELRDEIGVGSVGVVYAAYQPSVGREVAVRVFRSELVSDPRFIRRFEADAQRVATLGHPHLVPLLDYWRGPSGAYLVMRLMTGGTLRSVIEDRAPSPSEAMVIIEQVASALMAGHERGLYHGRVRPENVLYDAGGNLYVADLGLVAMLEGLVALPPAPHVAPEVRFGMVTARSDVYSLGMLAAELMAIPPTGDGARSAAGPRAVISKATTPDPSSRHGTVAEFLDELMTAVPTKGVARPKSGARNPYKGLAAFRESDAKDFFGRQRLTDTLVAAVADQALTVVTGPSGMGKSSAVFAGLIPTLRSGARPGSEDWLVTDLVPGAHPFDALTVALDRVALEPTAAAVEQLRVGGTTLEDVVDERLPPGTPLLVVIDQFEELFTLTADEVTRERFLDVLAAVAEASTGNLRVVVTLRADFFDRPLRHAAFGEVMASSVVAVHAMTADEITAVIERPLSRVGVDVDAALVDALVGDTQHDFGGLPLLQLVLTDLFETRRRDRLTLEEYRAAGALPGWIGRSAEAIYTHLDDDARNATREVFLRLVTVDEDTDETRRRARRTELERIPLDPDAIQRALEAFGRRRLLVFDRDPATRGPTVELAHEALIRHWDRLLGWVDQVRHDLLVRRRIEIAAADWRQAGNDPSHLLGGGRLSQAEEWAYRWRTDLTDDGRAFLEESRIAADQARQHTRRLRRRVLAGLATALVLVTILGLVAWIQRGIAQRETIATAMRELVAAAQLAIGEDPDLAILLALEAYDRSQTLGDDVPGDVITALQRTTQSSRLIARLPHGSSAAAFTPDGKLLAVDALDDRHQIVLYEVESGTEVARIEAGGPVRDFAISPDGTTLAVLFGDPLQDATVQGGSLPAVALFDMATFEAVGGLPGTCCPRRPVFSPDGRYLAASGLPYNPLTSGIDPGEVVTGIWDLEKPEAAPLLVRGYFGEWMSDSRTLVLRTGPNVVALVDAASGREVPQLEIPGPDISWIDVSPVSDEIAVLSGHGRTVEIWRVGDVTPVERVRVRNAVQAEFSADGTRLATFGDDFVQVLSLATGETLELRGVAGGSVDMEFSPDGRAVATVARSGGTTLWDVSEQGPPELGNIATAGQNVTSLAIPSDGKTLTAVESSGNTGRARVYDRTTGDVLVQSEEFFSGVGALPVVAAGGSMVAGVVSDRTGGRVDRLTDGETVLVFGECDTPIALDETGRWLVVDSSGRPIGESFRWRCNTVNRTRIIDLTTGMVVASMDAVAFEGDLGPPGTPAEDLVVIVNVLADPLPYLELRRIRPEAPTSQDQGAAGIEHIGSLPMSGLPMSGLLMSGYNAARPEFLTEPHFSSDGRYVALGSQTRGALVIDVTAAARGVGMEDAVVFNPVNEGGSADASVVVGDRLVTTHSGEMIRIWDMASQAQWLALPVDTGFRTAVAAAPDGRYLYYVDGGGVIRRFPLDTAELVDLARRRVTRDLTAEECRRYLADVDCSRYEA